MEIIMNCLELKGLESMSIKQETKSKSINIKQETGFTNTKQETESIYQETFLESRIYSILEAIHQVQGKGVPMPHRMPNIRLTRESGNPEDSKKTYKPE